MKINLAKAISLGKKPFVTSQKGRVGLGFVEEEKEKESFMKDARAPQQRRPLKVRRPTFLVLLKQRRFPKLRRSTLLVVVPQGAKPLVMTLRERLTPRSPITCIFYLLERLH